MAVVHANNPFNKHLIEDGTIRDAQVSDDAHTKRHKLDLAQGITDEDIVSVSASKVVGTISSSVDAANVTYSPVDGADWNAPGDPGNANAAFDELADRVATLEGTTAPEADDVAHVDGSQTSRIWEHVLAGSNITITELGAGEAIEIAATASSTVNQAQILAIASLRA